MCLLHLYPLYHIPSTVKREETNGHETEPCEHGFPATVGVFLALHEKNVGRLVLVL